MSNTKLEMLEISHLIPGAIFYKYGSSLIPAWMDNYIYNEVCYEITVQPLQFGNGWVLLLHYTGYVITYP